MSLSKPSSCVSLVNGLVNALNVRISALNAKEAGIYLIHSFSNALVTDIKRQKEPTKDEESPHRDRDMINKLRAVSEELLLVAAPATATGSAAFIALMTEVVTLQLWKTITSLDADFLNLTIVGRSEPAVQLGTRSRRRSFGPLVDLASSPSPTHSSFRPEVAADQIPPSPASSTSIAGPPDMRSAIDIFIKGPADVASNLLQQIELYLAEHPREIMDTSLTPSVRILQHVLTGQNEELADRFQVI